MDVWSLLPTISYLHPGRLTAGTCPHGGLVQIIFLSFHGWWLWGPAVNLRGCKDLVDHPIETTIYNWMFQVPGIYSKGSTGLAYLPTFASIINLWYACRLLPVSWSRNGYTYIYPNIQCRSYLPIYSLHCPIHPTLSMVHIPSLMVNTCMLYALLPVHSLMYKPNLPWDHGIYLPLGI